MIISKNILSEGKNCAVRKELLLFGESTRILRVFTEICKYLARFKNKKTAMSCCLHKIVQTFSHAIGHLKLRNSGANPSCC